MSKSIHTTFKEVFKNKTKSEIEEMCNPENPDYKVVELREKKELKNNEINRRKQKAFELELLN